MVERCVRLLRGKPRKSTSLLRPPEMAGGGGPCLGLKLLCEAHASSRVPSTEKCSEET